MGIELKIGDRINWTHTSHRGYGYTTVVAGILVKEGAMRVQIEVRERGIHEKNWRAQLKWVDKGSISSRVLPCAALNETMALDEKGFHISYCKHQNGVSTAFREGIFYGTIDSYEVAAPCGSAQGAVTAAYDALLNGGYEVSLLSAIDCYRGWLQQSIKDNLRARAEREIPELHARLEKLLDTGLAKSAANAHLA